MHTLRVHCLDVVAGARLAIVTLQTQALEVAQRLSNTQIGLVVVCDSDGAMAGVISKTDIVRQMGHCLGSACHTLAADLMTTEVISCERTDMLHSVLIVMQTHDLVHMPILNARQRPVGVVNARDALRSLVAADEYEQTLLIEYVMGVGYH